MTEVEATCEKAGKEVQKCSGCAETGETREIPALGHDAADEWTVTKEATCSEEGVEARLCTKCGAPVETRGIELIPHTPADEWTVTDDGLESGIMVEEQHCSLCDAVLDTRKTPNENHEHTYGDWVMIKDPTCTEKGERECVCTGCGEKKVEEVKALGHMYGEWEITKEATCGAAGSKKRVCSACGKEEVVTIAALAHEFGDWKVTKAATCSAKGEQSSTCKNCGKTETKEIAKLEHTWKDYGGGSLWTVTKAATCVNAGEKKCECTVCGYTATKEVPATGVHRYSDWYTTHTMNALQDGEEERACIDCGHKETRKVSRVVIPSDPSIAPQDINNLSYPVVVNPEKIQAKKDEIVTLKVYGWGDDVDGPASMCDVRFKVLGTDQYGVTSLEKLDEFAEKNSIHDFSTASGIYYYYNGMLAAKESCINTLCEHCSLLLTYFVKGVFHYDPVTCSDVYEGTTTIHCPICNKDWVFEDEKPTNENFNYYLYPGLNIEAMGGEGILIYAPDITSEDWGVTDGVDIRYNPNTKVVRCFIHACPKSKTSDIFSEAHSLAGFYVEAARMVNGVVVPN